MEKRSEKRKFQKGISLVEVVVALFVVSVLFWLLYIEFQTLSISQSQSYEDIAYHVASKEMESLRATSFGSLPSSGTISDSQLSQIPSGSGSFTVSNYAAYTGMKELVVTVTWNNGGNKSVVIRSLAASGGLNP